MSLILEIKPRGSNMEENIIYGMFQKKICSTEISV